jgi:hypothetical protein
MVMKCDFCGLPNVPLPYWKYPARDFFFPDDESESIGPWLACPPCHDLIEAENYESLSRISALTFTLSGVSEIIDEPVSEIQRDIQEIHTLFRDSRTGPAELMRNEENKS